MRRLLTRWLSAPDSNRSAPFRPGLTRLEDRANPVTVTTSAGVVFVDLDTAGETVTFTANATNFIGVVSDADGDQGNFSGFTSWVVTDSAAGTKVTFADSGFWSYAAAFDVALDNSPGQVTFDGHSDFGVNPLSVTTDRNIAVSGGASVTTISGNILFLANRQTAATGGNFIGVDVRGEVSSGSGGVSVSGRGGDSSSGSQHGVLVFNGGRIAAGGTGATSVTGTGGDGTGDGNHGVKVESPGSVITSGGGGVTVNGTGGGSTAFVLGAAGVAVTAGGVITAGGTGAVSVTGSGGPTTGLGNSGVSVNGAGSAIQSGGGGVTVFGTAGGNGSVEDFGVAVKAGGVITSGGTGAVSVTGTGGAGTADGNNGVSVSGAGSAITSGGGSVTAIGFGGGSGASESNFGVAVAYGGMITAGGTGAVSVTGTGGAGGGGSNYGVYLIDSAITSNGGGVTVIGFGGGTGASTLDDGVYLVNGGVITAGGSGAVSVTGTGGTGSLNAGVAVANADAVITSGGGGVTVVGVGGGSGTSGANLGVLVTLTGQITAGGTGAVSVTGTGGTGSGAGNYGVYLLLSSPAVTSNGGAVSVTATAGTGTDNYAAVLGTGGISSGSNAAVTVTADSLSVDGTSTISAGTGTVTLQTRTAGTRLDLGGADALTGTPLTLGLTDAELDQVTAGTLVLGRGTAGDITLTADITRPAGTGVQLVTAGDLASTPSAGSLNTGGGPLTLAVAGAVRPLRTGTDFTASTVTFAAGADLALAVGGPAADTGFTRLSVSGAVDLAGVDLALSGGYAPAAGDSFALVSAANVTGAFNGLAAGAAVTLNGVNTHLFYTGTSASLVVNRPPTGVSAGGPYVINEGDGLVVSAPAATDPDGDALTYTWDVNGDGTFGDESLGTVSAGGRTVTYTASQLLALGLADGAFNTALLAVRASDGLSFGTATSFGSLTVTNVAPDIAVSGIGSASEGALYTLTLGAVTDPGQDAVTQYRVNWGDGTSDTYATAGAKTHTYADDGAYTVTVDVTDEDGTFANVGTAHSVAVSNVAPLVTLLTTPSRSEMQPITAAAYATDPGGVNDPLAFAWSVTKDGRPYATATGGSFTFTPDDNGTYTVSVTVSDGDGGQATASETLTVNNVPPVITSVTVPASGVGGKPLTVAATASDVAGANDPLTFTWTVTRNGVVFATGIGATFTYTPPVGGTFDVALTVTDGDGGVATASRSVAVTLPAREVTTVGGTVTVRDLVTGSTREVVPFPGFLGGVTTATADLNGDGVLDLAVAAGAGGGPHVRAYDGVSGMEVASFMAFDVAFTGGVSVAAAGGRLVVGAGAGGSPHVKVIDVARIGERRADGVIAESALTANFFAFDGAFTGGVSVAAADVTGDGVPDVVVGAGPGGSPHVKGIDGTKLAQVRPDGVIADSALFANFFAFDPGFAGGVNVAATGGRIAVAAGAGAGPHVKVIDYANLGRVRADGVIADAALTANFMAFDLGFTGGVRVRLADVNADGVADLLTAAGPGGGPHLKAFNVAPLFELQSMFVGNPNDPSGVVV